MFLKLYEKRIFFFTWIVLLLCGLLTTSSCEETPETKLVGELSGDPRDFRITALRNGDVLITGEVKNISYYQEHRQCPRVFSVELYDHKKKKLLRLDDLNFVGYRHSSTLLKDGRVLLTGGIMHGCGGALKSAAVYNTQTQKFSKLPEMKHAREGHSTILLNEGVVLIVGNSENYGKLRHRAVEIFDPVKNKFEEVAPTIYSHVSPMLTLLPDGKVLVAGGKTEKAELYDPKMKLFRALPDMAYKRIGSSVISQPSGKVLFIGGEGQNAVNASSVEMYDPLVKKFALVGSLDCVRRGHSAIPYKGKVLIVGGRPDNGVCWNSAVLYDPSINKITPFMRLREFRAYQKMTLLRDGSVLILGGEDSRTSRPIPSLELLP